MRWAIVTKEQRVLGALLAFVAATLLSTLLPIPAWIRFFMAVAAIVPLAGFIGAATEALADRLGARVGGLFNATFGNSPDLLVGVIGVQKNLIPLVKATLVGALISNSALIMGLCYLAAGLKYGRPRFNRHEAGHHSVLMMLTLAAVVFPSVGALVLCGGVQCSRSADASSGRLMFSREKVLNSRSRSSDPVASTLRIQCAPIRAHGQRKSVQTTNVPLLAILAPPPSPTTPPTSPRQK